MVTIFFPSFPFCYGRHLASSRLTTTHTRPPPTSPSRSKSMHGRRPPVPSRQGQSALRHHIGRLASPRRPVGGGGGEGQIRHLSPARRARQTPSPRVVNEDLLALRTPRNWLWQELPNTTPLEESIPDSAPTVPHETIGSSSSTSTSTCQKPVAAADSTYAPGLQEPDGPSLDEFLDNSSGQKLVEGVVSSLEKLHDTSTSYEESNIADPQTMTQNTIDGSLRTLPSRSEKFVTGAADSTSILTLQEPDVSSSDEYLDSSSEELITASPRTVPLNTIDDSPPTLGPNILIYYPADSFEVFYIRIDRRGSIWIYPNVGGPFQSIDETENAIISFLHLWQRETSGHCFGCKNNGSPDMQHPVEADAYTGGHLDGYLPFDFDALSSSDDDDGEYEYLYKDEDEEDEEEEFEVW